MFWYSLYTVMLPRAWLAVGSDHVTFSSVLLMPTTVGAGMKAGTARHSRNRKS